MALKARSVNMAVTPKALSSLIGSYPYGHKGEITGRLILQPGENNSNKIYFGDSTEQPFYIDVDGSAYLPERIDLTEFYVKGTPPDTLSILLL